MDSAPVDGGQGFTGICMKSNGRVHPHSDTPQIASWPWRNIALFLVTTGTLVLCVRMGEPFLPAIVAAIVLAVISHRPFTLLHKRIRNRTAAAAIATTVVTACVIAPLLLVGQVIAQYITRVLDLLQNGSLAAGLKHSMDRLSQLSPLFHSGSKLLTLAHAAERAAEFVAINIVSILSNSFATATQLVLTLFILFFLYRDERIAKDYVERLMPMSRGESRQLMSRIGDTIRATFLGNFLVAAIQGLASGIMFAALRVSDAAVLGVLVAIAAIVPYFGAYVVWLPVGIYLAVSGHWISAVVVLAVGSIVVSSLDNLLYPMFVGGRLRQHPVTVLVSLLGGVWMFGVSGLIVGPVLFSVAESLIAIWRLRLRSRRSLSISGQEHVTQPIQHAM